MMKRALLKVISVFQIISGLAGIHAVVDSCLAWRPLNMRRSPSIQLSSFTLWESTYTSQRRRDEKKSVTTPVRSKKPPNLLFKNCTRSR